MAASILREQGKVAVLDLDYHHGNGTQEFFYSDPRVFTLSIHGDPELEYPYFWGYAEETGSDEGEGANLNIPLPLGSENKRYLKAVERAVSKIEEFAPDYLVIAAGFDTHRDDPIGGLDLTTRVYPTIGERLASLALPTVICQEGGYNPEVLGDCVLGFLQGFEKAR
jgi:acetoin utilization deacetylase AcuC-like enzyme